ncbi:hypothetical protein GQ53DRAFT_853391 [Thozetella sp. PMI_491]|nr:hypothetical protein GQ53DRAFT_853391 [Thozetella sp. PMI_491]
MNATTDMSRRPTSKALACDLCHRRKIKCDRQVPCSNCLKTNVICSPQFRTVGASVRKPPKDDLRARLGRCEALLMRVETRRKTLSQSNSPAAPSPAPVQATEVTDVEALRRATQKLSFTAIVDDDGPRFTDSYMWATLREQLNTIAQMIADRDENGMSTGTGSTPCSLSSSEEYDAASDDQEVVPSGAQILSLWQIFIERVNPFIKLIHIPSLQPLVVQALAGHAQLPADAQALLSAVYLVAVLALKESESMQVLGRPKEEAAKQFTSAAQDALKRSYFLERPTLMKTQAMTLLLIAFQGRYHRHAAWVLCGVLIRIAQKMGLHRDGEELGLPPFEAEMRRRLWWQIVLLDMGYGVASGYLDTAFPWDWHTELPQNVSDADISPDSKDPIKPREGAAEMALPLMFWELGKFIVEEKLFNFEAVALGTSEASTASSSAAGQASAKHWRKLVQKLESRFIALERGYGPQPTSCGTHVIAASIRPVLIDTMRSVLMPMKDLPEWGTEVRNEEDNVFRIYVIQLEHDIMVYERIKDTVFSWFFDLIVRIDVLAFLAGQLCRRTTGTLVSRAWKAIDRMYHYREKLLDMSKDDMVELGCLMLEAWAARAQVLRNLGLPCEAPLMIPSMQAALNKNESSPE